MIAVALTPRINTNDDRVEVVTWHAAQFDLVRSGQDLLDIETSKSVVTLAAEREGFLDQLVGPGTVVRVGDPLYRTADSLEEIADRTRGGLDPADTAARADLDAPPLAAAPGLSTESDSLHMARYHVPSSGRTQDSGLPRLARTGTRFSNAAREAMKLKGLSEDAFIDAGLVTGRSILARYDSSPARTALTQQAGASNDPERVTVPVADLNTRHERISLAKRGEIEALAVGQSGNINSTLSIQFDSAPIRRRLAAERICGGSIQPLILFEAARLLKAWPQFTAYFNDGVHFYDRVDLGLAVDLGHGLKVVTIKDADSLMPMQIYEKILDIGNRYLERQLTVDELSNSTITVTDLSALDILHFLPLINGRQSAIIGIGGDGEQGGHPMSLIITFDHRIANGREVAVFLRELRSRILSYGENVDIPERPPRLEPPSAEQGPHPPAPSPATVACDFCSIGLRDYYEHFGRSAHLLTYYREDGSLGAVCHRCFACWK